MDLNLPGIPGVEAIRRIVEQPDPPTVLVLTMVDDDDTVTAALQVGARGYLLKGALPEDVLAAIRAVAAGGVVLGAGAAERMTSGRQRYRVDLTEREAQVLALIGDGSSNAEIARELGLSLKTVQNHVSNVLAKLQRARQNASRLAGPWTVETRSDRRTRTTRHRASVRRPAQVEDAQVEALGRARSGPSGLLVVARPTSPSYRHKHRRSRRWSR